MNSATPCTCVQGMDPSALMCVLFVACLGLAYGADDARASEVAREFGGPAISFGFSEPAAY